MLFRSGERRKEGKRGEREGAGEGGEWGRRVEIRRLIRGDQGEGRKQKRKKKREKRKESGFFLLLCIPMT